MFMRKNGFTLIEVIVSIALLGIISIGFLGALTNNLNFLKINKSMTASAFLDQKDMEHEILQTRADIKDGTIAAGSMTTLNNVFESGVSVKAYQLKFPYNKQDIYTLVTDTRLPEFKVPIAQNVVAQLRTGTNPVSFAYAVADTNVLGSSSIDPSTTDVFMVNNYNWYASRPGFNIPMPNTPIPEIEIGNKYPKFPEDYSLIPTSTSLNLNDVRAYAGRHIVFAVTPAAKSGRMGQTVPSKPVYISGLPVIASTDLFLHLDASTISNTDASQVAANGSGDLLVKNWIDLSTNAKNATNTSDQPKLKENSVGVDFVGKFVDFDTSKNLKVIHNTINNATLNVFAVVRGNNSAVFYSNGGTNIAVSGVPFLGDWKIVTKTYTSSNRNFTLGNFDVDVAELIIFRGTFTEADKNKVIEYLTKKYIPLDVVGNIVSLRPMTDVEIIKDTPYNLPYAVLAEMEHGSDRFVPVNWTPNTINTSSVGTYTFTATAINDNTKTTTLKVIVKDFVHVSSISLNKTTLNLLVDETESLKPTILPIDATNKAITWESSDSSVVAITDYDHTGANIKALKAGTANITVTTVDGNKKATCVVTVTPILEEWQKTLILHLDANVGVTTSSGNITEWKDQSGKNNHFIQGIANTNRHPSLASAGNGYGMNVVKFNGDDFLTLNRDYLSTPTGNQNLDANDSNQFSIFMVSRANYPGSNSNQYTFFSKSDGWGNKVTYVFGRVGNNFKIRVKGNEVNSTTANNNYNLHTSIYSGKNSLIYNDNNNYYWLNSGNQSNAKVGTQGVQSNNIVLGASNSGSGNRLNGDIAEVRIYNSALTAEQRNIVENELKDKWLSTPVKEWNFDSTIEGWRSEVNISNFKRVSDSSLNSGVISGSILTGDPYFHSPASLNINTSEATKIVIRLKNNTTSNMGQIYFTTTVGSTNNGYDEARHIDFAIVPNSGYIDYEINVGSLASWTGTVNEFRIDPAVNALGSFSIDYVKIY